MLRNSIQGGFGEDGRCSRGVILKPFLASLLAVLVVQQVLTAGTPEATDFAQMAKALGVGAKVEVQLVGGSYVRGRTAAVEPEALSISVGRAGAGKVRTVAFTNVVSSKRQPATHNPFWLGLLLVHSWRWLSLPFRFY